MWEAQGGWSWPNFANMRAQDTCVGRRVAWEMMPFLINSGCFNRLLFRLFVPAKAVQVHVCAFQ